MNFDRLCQKKKRILTVVERLLSRKL